MNSCTRDSHPGEPEARRVRTVQGSKFKNGYSSNRFSRFSRKPFAAVVPIRNADEDTVALSTNRNFMTIIDRSRARAKKQGGISAKEERRRLGIH
jgi:hypothetical protein